MNLPFPSVQLGLSFKPNTDDMRLEASLSFLESVWSSGAKVRAYELLAMEKCQRVYGSRPNLSLVGTKALER